jgi:hypothetical protein
MKKNLGTTDRLVRLTIACLLAAFALWQMSILIALVALFVFLEAAFSWCPLYQLFGKDSCKPR